MRIVRRCKARLHPGVEGAGECFGRCDLLAGHDGNHQLERGMFALQFVVELAPHYPPMPPATPAHMGGDDAAE